MGDDALVVAARAAVDDSQYLTLATADDEGRPWASPVWYAHRDYVDFFWVSSPGARHSRNIAARPEVAIVIFDSTVPIGSASAVYVDAVAAEVSDDEVEAGIAIFAARSAEMGGQAWTTADVTGSARHRLYRARAREAFVLGARDERVSVALA